MEDTGLLLIKLMYAGRYEVESKCVERDYDDVNVEVDGKVFLCNRTVLASNSLYFECLFNGNFKEANDNTISLPPEYVNKESFSKLLNAMYGETLQMDDDLASLFVACSYLQLARFMDECERRIIRSIQNIDLTKLIALPQLKERTSLYAKVFKHVCKHFSEIYPRLIRLPYPVIEELLRREELLIFSRIDALKFCKLWLSHYRRERKIYRRRIYRLLEPFRSYRKAQVVIRSKRYVRDNLNPADMVQLFRSPSFQEDQPLYTVVKDYICENFSKVHQRLLTISYRSLSNLLSDVDSFSLERSAREVVDFGWAWLNHDASRDKYKNTVDLLLKPFVEFIGEDYWCCWDNDLDADSYDSFSDSISEDCHYSVHLGWPNYFSYHTDVLFSRQHLGYDDSDYDEFLDDWET